MSDILSLLSGGIIGGFLGAFLGGFAKFFWEQWLPSQLTWRREQKVEREKLLSQFRGPTVRAISELQWRITVIAEGNSRYDYLLEHGLADYYIKSTAFLIGQFYAWAEILRQRLQVLDYSELIVKLEDATRSFSAGRPGFQIFRLEQREIGERMIVRSSDAGQDCLGYSDFLEKMKGDNVPACFTRLEDAVKHLMDHSLRETIRLAQIQHSLIDLIDFIDPESRWVPKGERSKFDVVRQLEESLEKKKIHKADYNELIHQAQEAGLAKPVDSRNLESKSS
jgi:hypothetical protein